MAILYFFGFYENGEYTNLNDIIVCFNDIWCVSYLLIDSSQMIHVFDIS